ncbi:MAG: nucleotidyl transferase AbiEii/AbiGii toxin family protein [Sediminibacterium sp.]|nr:nucleotidyl transferase AbiEii/AbiGii toxin family protein [Sediminibacterium sp.]
MISQKEIRTIAEKLKVPSDTIDKDYVLGHFLNELFKQPWAINNLIFKGGTCLKKCYFEEYRFSEDIDATITNPSFELTKKQIEVICNDITNKIGISFRILKFEKTLFKDQHIGWDIEICFWGANHSKNELPKFGKDCHTKIWCEFRFYEIVLFPSENRRLIHLFSDADKVDISIPCYSLKEVLAEKMRSLIQRNRGEARDYFDLWYIKNNNHNINWEEVKMAFLQKCAFKSLEFTSVSDFFEPDRIKQVEITWDIRLNHQLPQKVDRILILKELELFFFDLFK